MDKYPMATGRQYGAAFVSLIAGLAGLAAITGGAFLLGLLLIAVAIGCGRLVRG